MTILFNSLPLSSESLRAIKECGYETPTPVQAGVLPIALETGDLLVQSQTGTGKTAAFMLPLIEKLSGSTKIGALVLTPTRELAVQVAQEGTQLAKYHSLKICTIYGGVAFDPQITRSQTSQILVGTPGRVLDHLKRRTIDIYFINDKFILWTSYSVLRCCLLDTTYLVFVWLDCKFIS